MGGGGNPQDLSFWRTFNFIDVLAKNSPIFVGLGLGLVGFCRKPFYFALVFFALRTELLLSLAGPHCILVEQFNQDHVYRDYSAGDNMRDLYGVYGISQVFQKAHSTKHCCIKAFV